MAKKIQLTKNGEDVYPITVPDSIAGLAQVAKTGSYNDLSDKPSIPLPSPPEVFLITRDVTTYAEIYAAVNAGKVCMMYNGDDVYTVTYCENGEPIHLYTYRNNGIGGVEISPEDDWDWVAYYYTDSVVFHAIIGHTTLDQIFYAVNAHMIVLGRATEDAMGDELYSLVAISYGNQGYALFSRTDEDGTVYFAKVTKSGNQESWSYSERFIASSLSDLSSDSTHRTVTDTEKATWNAKAEIFVAEYDVTPYADIKDAYNAGKTIILKTDYTSYGLISFIDGSATSSASICFYCISDDLSSIEAYAVSSSDVWSHGSVLIPLSLADLSQNSTHRTVTDTEKATWNAKYTKPASGIPASDIAAGVIPDVSNFITKSVNDLANYYLKSETYTKDEVAALIGAIQQFHYEIVATLPATGEGNVLYLLGPTGTGADKYEEYVYANSTWTKIGDTSISLAGYVTTQELNAALANYWPKADVVNITLSDLAVSGDWDDIENNPIPEPSASDNGKVLGVTNAHGTLGWVQSGGVTSVGLSVPTCLQVTGSPITSSGTLAVTFKTGYSIPTDAKQSGWDAKYDKPSGGIPASDIAAGVIPSVESLTTAEIDTIWNNAS